MTGSRGHLAHVARQKNLRTEGRDAIQSVLYLHLESKSIVLIRQFIQNGEV